jgi:hypothetical protein
MIPLLVTMDLEYASDHNENEQRIILEKLCNDLKSIKLPITIFVTSEFANKFPEETIYIYDSGNEIGCHGLNHSRSENYKKIGEEKISHYLTTASKNIQNKIQEKPVCFRGPGMSTSPTTQKILIKNGYIADFSVCSQRIDFFNSMGGDIRWLFAPRYPYNPSVSNPYIKGDLPIWVIPLSSFIVPFMSGSLYLFGLNFMKRFFNLLVKESIKKNKPIIYLFHSYEFTKFTGTPNKNQFNKNHYRSKRPIIHRVYRSDIVKRYKANLELLKYMLSFDTICPYTGKKFCERLSNNIS